MRPGAPSRRQTRTQAGPPPRQRRQGLPLRLPRRQRLSSGFLPIHAGTSSRLRSRRSTATHPSSSRCATPASSKASAAPCEYKEICGGLTGTGLRGYGDPLGAGAMLHLPAQNWDSNSRMRRRLLRMRSSRSSRSSNNPRPISNQTMALARCEITRFPPCSLPGCDFSRAAIRQYGRALYSLRKNSLGR